MFGRVAAGLVHDLLASDPEHRQQRAPARCATTSTSSRAMSSAAPSIASSRRSSGSWTICATSSSRSRSNASRWTSTARWRKSSSRCGRKASATASRSRRNTRPGPLVIEGDRFALGRVYRNLITNAIQATAAGRARHHRHRPRRRSGRDHAWPTPARAFPPSVSRPSSTTSSRPSAAASASAWRSPSASSNSSTAPSPSQSEVGRGTTFTLAVPGARRSSAAGSGKLAARRDEQMFRTLVKTDALAVRRSDRLRCAISSSGRCAARAVTAPRSCLDRETASFWTTTR